MGNRIHRMRRSTGNAGACLAIALMIIGASHNHAVGQNGLNDKHVKYIEEHCSDCHSGESSEGGFNVDSLEIEIHQEEFFNKWERIHDRIASGEMPPKDADELEPDLKAKFLKSISGHLTDTHLQIKSTVLRRLNRVEYENTLNDLFGTQSSLAGLLPEDGRSHEFDNIGSALNVSMVHLKKYMEAARVVLDEAITQSTERPKVNRVEGNYAETREGKEFIGKVWKQAPDGAVVRFEGGGYPSGMMRSAGVRTAGRYRIKVTGYAYQSDEPITFSVGGTTFKRGAEKPTFGFFSFRPGKPQTIELEAKIESNYMIQIEPYGIRDPQRYQRKSIADYKGPGLAIKSVVVEGPLLTEFPSKGHRLVFDGINRSEIEPRDPRQKTKPWYKAKFEIKSENESRDASRSLKRIAEGAFRQAVTDSELQPYIQLFESERKNGSSFEDSLRQAAVAIFCSPRFLFLQETEGKLDDYAIASRLSYFINRSMPDAELMDLARNGQLSQQGEVGRQLDRLTKSAHFDRFIVDFVDSWLNLREIDFTIPDSNLFPEFDDYLRYSMPLETRAFLTEMFASNLPVRNLVKSDFAMLNQRLAELYEIPGVIGPQIRKVSLPENSVRGGVLSQASILKVSANGTNTSPVVRGVWVMERILGETPLPPPPGVPGVEPDIRGATTLREQLDKHRNLSQCQSCHRAIDPPGFALEYFNPIGGFRSRYRSMGEGERLAKLVNGRNVRYRLGPPVDGSGQLVSGEKFKDFEEFRRVLINNDQLLAKAFTQKLLTFATGRELGFSDRAEVDRIVQATAPGGFRVKDLLHQVVTSPVFLTK